MDSQESFDLSADLMRHGSLKDLLQVLRGITSLSLDIKKLKNHPIQDWVEYFSDSLAVGLIDPAFLMMNEKEVLDLCNDFKKSQDAKLVDLLTRAKAISSSLCDKFTEPEARKNFLQSNQRPSAHLETWEISTIRQLRAL